MIDRSELLIAVKCCREDRCDECPLQEKICDELRITMESIPADLLDLIEEELEQ